MRRLTLTLLIAAVAVAGCGGSSTDDAATLENEGATTDATSSIVSAPSGTAEPPAPSTTIETPQLPPLSASFDERFFGFYRGAFLSDGYPGRITDDGVVPHPIYGTYVINDYLTQLRSAEGERLDDLQAGLRTVAEAAVARMDTVGDDALAFYYEPEWELGGRHSDRLYSGLTQAYYAVALHRAGVALDDDDLVEAGRRAFESLLVPQEDGGVLVDTGFGPAYAELPAEPSSLILNGWLSILVSMQRYAEETGDPAVADLVIDSAEVLAELLPLYDVPELRSSRYGLTGFLPIRFSGGASFELTGDLIIEVPGHGSHPAPRAPADTTRWESFVSTEHLDGDRVNGGVLDANVVLSLLSDPAPNIVRLPVAGSGEITLEASAGAYDPLTASPTQPTWQVVGRAVPVDGVVEFELPWDLIGPVVYPTNFAKLIDEQQTNVYHGIHVRRLRQLHEATGIDELSEWAERWADGICDWDTVPAFEGLSVSLTGTPIPVAEVDQQVEWCLP